MRDHHSPHREHGDGRDGFEKRPGPGRERGGRGPRVFAPGDLKLLLLALIAEQPCHGYDLIRQIESMFDGAYSPSPGVIYPTLTFLEESEMILGDAEGGKKRYSITDAGRLSLSEQAIALDGVRMRIEVSKRSLRGHDRPAEIHEAVHNLRHALQMHHGRWSPVEILRVRDLLNNTAKAIVDGPVIHPTSEKAE
ncbi:PadR family transcriptional regulator [Pseudomonas farris]